MSIRKARLPGPTPPPHRIARRLDALVEREPRQRTRGRLAAAPIREPMPAARSVADLPATAAATPAEE